MLPVLNEKRHAPLRQKSDDESLLVYRGRHARGAATHCLWQFLSIPFIVEMAVQFSHLLNAAACLTFLFDKALETK